MKTITVKIDNEAYEKLKATATKHNESISGVLRLLIQRRLPMIESDLVEMRIEELLENYATKHNKTMYKKENTYHIV